VVDCALTGGLPAQEIAAHLRQQILVEVTTRQQKIVLQGIHVLHKICSHRHQVPEMGGYLYIREGLCLMQ